MIYLGNAKDYIDRMYNDKMFIQHLKEQERVAVRAIIAREQMTIQALQKE